MQGTWWWAECYYVSFTAALTFVYVQTTYLLPWINPVFAIANRGQAWTIYDVKVLEMDGIPYQTQNLVVPDRCAGHIDICQVWETGDKLEQGTTLGRGHKGYANHDQRPQQAQAAQSFGFRQKC